MVVVSQSFVRFKQENVIKHHGAARRLFKHTRASWNARRTLFTWRIERNSPRGGSPRQSDCTPAKRFAGNERARPPRSLRRRARRAHVSFANARGRWRDTSSSSLTTRSQLVTRRTSTSSLSRSGRRSVNSSERRSNDFCGCWCLLSWCGSGTAPVTWGRSCSSEPTTRGAS
jgi:hypothetical protein